MNNSQRILVNTIAQYFRTIVNVILSFFSVRIIMSVIGVEDYGIYSLIAGVVSMLAFINNALALTTQRYLSIYQGKKENEKLTHYFVNSVFLHLFLGFIIVLLIEVFGIIFFDSLFIIPIERVKAAKMLFYLLGGMILFSFITTPFRALLISHENIVYTSLIDIIDGVLKLSIALYLASVRADKLIVYGILMSAVVIFNFLVLAIYCYKKYDECKLPSLHFFKTNYIKDLTSFAVWNIYSMGCIVGRNQGMAIIINHFVGTLVNAAYGVSVQIHAAISQISSSLMNAINPQIIKAEGASDRNKMLRLSEIASKFCFLLLSMISIPTIIEMPALLDIWLREVPEYAVFFSRIILIACLCDMLTYGLNTANQAVGKIKIYSIVLNTLKIITLPVMILLLNYGCSIKIAMLSYLFIELFCALLRLPFLRMTANLSVKAFIYKVFIKEILPVTLSIVTCLCIKFLINSEFRFLVTFSISIPLFALSTYKFSLCSDEKVMLSNLINSFLHMLKK